MDLNSRIEVLKLSTYAKNSLLDAGIDTVEKLINLTNVELKNIRFIGNQIYSEIKLKLYENGLKLKDDLEELNFEEEKKMLEENTNVERDKMRVKMLLVKKRKVEKELNRFEEEKEKISYQLNKKIQECVEVQENLDPLDDKSELKLLKSIEKELLEKIEIISMGIKIRRNKLKELNTKIEEINKTLNKEKDDDEER